MKRFRTASVGVVVLVLLLATPVSATPLAPFIDLQEAGLTLVTDGEGLGAGFPVTLTVNVGGPVRFALLYWAGRQTPCSLSGADCVVPSQPYNDQQLIFNGTPITGTIIGSESQNASSTLNIGYFADVTSLVAAAGTGVQSFPITDGNGALNLTQRDGVALIVAYTDPANPAFFRVLVWDGLDSAWLNDPTAGDNRVTAPVTLSHGVNTAPRTAQLYLGVGGGTLAGTDSVTIANNPTLVNTLDSSNGATWDLDLATISIPAGVATTTVQVNSGPGGTPDQLRWEFVMLRVQGGDVVPPSCASQLNAGPPQQAVFTVQDTGGLASIVVTLSQNADTVVPPFAPGTTDPVTITSTKIDQTQPMVVELRIQDVQGNLTICGIDQTPTPTPTATITPTATATATLTPTLVPGAIDVPVLDARGLALLAISLAAIGLLLSRRLGQ